MLKLRIYFLGFILGLFAISACNNDNNDDDVVNEAEVLVKYLESTNSPYGKYYVNTDMPSITSASKVRELNLTGAVYIIDIRAAADYDAGHIENAVNVAFGDVLSHMESINPADYQQVALVCYSGQSAGYATSILRLMGYDNVYSMKWGMSSWNSNFSAPWNNTIANGNAFASQFVSTPSTKNEQGNLPTISTGSSDPQQILEARVAEVLAAGYGSGVASVTNQAVFDNLNNYYIINYWPENQYTDPGHIPGAIQYTPKETIAFDVDLRTLPTDKPIVVYCYTGQTSSFMAAYLRILGYDAKSLLFGANGMIYDALGTAGLTQFNDGEIMEYDYVP